MTLYGDVRMYEPNIKPRPAPVQPYKGSVPKGPYKIRAYRGSIDASDVKNRRKPYQSSIQPQARKRGYARPVHRPRQRPPPRPRPKEVNPVNRPKDYRGFQPKMYDSNIDKAPLRQRPVSGYKYRPYKGSIESQPWSKKLYDLPPDYYGKDRANKPPPPVKTAKRVKIAKEVSKPPPPRKVKKEPVRKSTPLREPQTRQSPVVDDPLSEITRRSPNLRPAVIAPAAAAAALTALPTPPHHRQRQAPPPAPPQAPPTPRPTRHFSPMPSPVPVLAAVPIYAAAAPARRKASPLPDPVKRQDQRSPFLYRSPTPQHRTAQPAQHKYQDSYQSGRQPFFSPLIPLTADGKPDAAAGQRPRYPLIPVTSLPKIQQPLPPSPPDSPQDWSYSYADYSYRSGVPTYSAVGAVLRSWQVYGH